MWEEGPIPGELGMFPGYLLARLGDAARRRFIKALMPEGIHPRQFGVMTMVAVIDDLEARGLAERRPHPDDRRARAIYLTTAGEDALARMRGLAAHLQRELFSPLSSQEARTLHALLLKLATAAGAARVEAGD